MILFFDRRRFKDRISDKNRTNSFVEGTWTGTSGLGVKPVTESNEYPKFIMQGSYMDGLNIDLVGWCGLPPLTDEEHDKVWGETNDIEIIRNCLNAEIEETEGPDVPLMTDTFVYVRVDSEESHKRLKKEVRESLEELRDGQ